MLVLDCTKHYFRLGCRLALDSGENGRHGEFQGTTIANIIDFFMHPPFDLT